MKPTTSEVHMDNIGTLANAIIADNKNGDIDVEEIIFGKLNISDLPLLAELLEGHGSSNEMNTADYALAAINKALGA
ncbi:MAG: hypothetical protein P1U85_21740 [Verrucomicrobiales bacterium]|nr:hypothetical protein [Verrucomicrobiales bacterium]